jgi:hypothetical protein
MRTCASGRGPRGGGSEIVRKDWRGGCRRCRSGVDIQTWRPVPEVVHRSGADIENLPLHLTCTLSRSGCHVRGAGPEAPLLRLARSQDSTFPDVQFNSGTVLEVTRYGIGRCRTVCFCSLGDSFITCSGCRFFQCDRHAVILSDAKSGEFRECRFEGPAATWPSASQTCMANDRAFARCGDDPFSQD